MDDLRSLLASQGQLGHRVTVTTQDEIGRVSQAFNEMAERLQASHPAEAAAVAELRRSNTELDQFAYVASYDLKAPLRGIRNPTDWIAEDRGPDVSEDTRENLALLYSRVDRLDRLPEALLDYSRVGRREAAMETVDVARLVDEIAEYVAPPAGFSITHANLSAVQAPRPARDRAELSDQQCHQAPGSNGGHDHRIRTRPR